MLPSPPPETTAVAVSVVGLPITSTLMPDDDQQAALAVAALVDASVSTLP